VAAKSEHLQSSGSS